MVIRFEGDDDMRNAWGEERAFEFLWEGGEVLASERARILTHIIRWNYGDMLSSAHPWDPPDGSRHPPINFQFDTAKLNNASDVQQHAKSLVDWSRRYATVYQGPSLAVWGSDFQFTQAGQWFSQMDQVIEEINAHPDTYGNASVRYTTLAGYFDHLNALDLEFPVKKSVSFEYGWPHAWTLQLTGNSSTQYQTGAPASRAAHKQHIRRSAELTRAAQLAHAVALAAGKLPSSLADDLQPAWDANAVCQHHDSVPGTMNSAQSFTNEGSYIPPVVGLPYDADVVRCGAQPNCRVLEDYTARLAEGQAASEAVLSASLRALSGAASDLVRVPTNTTNTVLVYNALAHDRTAVVGVPFARGAGEEGWPTVLDSSGTAIAAQLSPNDELNAIRTPLPRLFKDIVYFEATVPALGFSTYTMQFGKDGSPSTFKPAMILGPPPDPIENELLAVYFDQETGLMEQIARGPEHFLQASQTFHEYIDGQGGAYCLVMTAEARRVATPFNVSHVVGPLFSQVTQTFSSNGGMQQWVRLLKGADVVEVEHHVGRLSAGREVVSRIETSLSNNGVLQTDDSGFPEMHSRPRNASGPISQNYHALVQSASISGGHGQQQLSVLSRRTVAVASLGDGEIEYMLARRLIDSTDSQGPWPLDEQDDIRDTMWLAVGEEGAASDVEAMRMPRALELEHALLPLFLEGGAPPPTATLAPITPLPPHVFLDLFVRHSCSSGTGAAEYAIRLQSVLAQGMPTTNVSLAALRLGTDNTEACAETTLTMQQVRATNAAQRLQWRAQPLPVTLPTPSPTASLSELLASWHATGCTTAALPYGEAVTWASWTEQHVLADMYAWCTDAKAGESQETGCCGSKGCGKSLGTCTLLTVFATAAPTPTPALDASREPPSPSCKAADSIKLAPLDIRAFVVSAKQPHATH